MPPCTPGFGSRWPSDVPVHKHHELRRGFRWHYPILRPRYSQDATRISTLDPNGYPAIGSATYTTDTLVKATIAPALETGDDLVAKNASGNIAYHFEARRHAEVFTVRNLEMATLESVLIFRQA